MDAESAFFISLALLNEGNKVVIGLFYEWVDVDGIPVEGDYFYFSTLV